MKILMLIDRYIPIWGGAENQLRQLIPHLEKKGCSVTLLTRRWHRNLHSIEFIDGTKVNRVGFPGETVLATLSYVIGVVWFIFKNRKNIDVIHSHGAVALGALGRFAGLIANRPNVVKIATAGRIPRLRNARGIPLLHLFKKSTAIICMTEEINNELRSVGADTRRVHRITNAVDHLRFKPAIVEERRKWRIRKGIEADATLHIFSGRLVYRKGLDILLSAWPKVTRNHGNSYLFVLGSGDNQPDSIERSALRKLKTEDICNVFFEGEVENPAEYLNVADIFVLPSRKEGMPNTLLEAMAAGLAAISSNIGGAVDLIEDGKTGMLFGLNHADQLGTELINLNSDTRMIKELGSQARTHVMEHYTFERISGEYVALYRKLKTTAQISNP